MNIQLQYPQALWLLGLIPLFVLLLFRYLSWKKKALQRIGDAHLVERLYSYSPVRFSVKAFLAMLAFAAGCLALANPRRPDVAETQVKKGIDVAIALDISNSMLAADVAPSRLAAAKELINTLLARLPDDRVSFVVFAGNAYVQVPLTFDKEAIALAVATAQPGTAGVQGTSLGGALEKSALTLKQDEDRFKAIILLTDGETHDENAVQTAKTLMGRGVMINSIGIGSVSGITLKAADGTDRRDKEGNIVISKLNEAVLQQITGLSGKYVHLQTAEATVVALMQQLSGIERKGIGDAARNYSTLYMWLAVPALLLLIAELFISNRKKGTV